MLRQQHSSENVLESLESGPLQVVVLFPFSLSFFSAVVVVVVDCVGFFWYDEKIGMICSNIDNAYFSVPVYIFLR